VSALAADGSSGCRAPRGRSYGHRRGAPAACVAPSSLSSSRDAACAGCATRMRSRPGPGRGPRGRPGPAPRARGRRRGLGAALRKAGRAHGSSGAACDAGAAAKRPTCHRCGAASHWAWETWGTEVSEETRVGERRRAQLCAQLPASLRFPAHLGRRTAGSAAPSTTRAALLGVLHTARPLCSTSGKLTAAGSLAGLAAK